MFGKITTINIKSSNGDEPELIDEMMKNERFVIPEVIKNEDGSNKRSISGNIKNLWERRHQPGNGERIDLCLHAIEEANGTKLKR